MAGEEIQVGRRVWVHAEKRVLWVEPFYWGVRTMLLRLTRDATLMADVEASIREGFAKYDEVVDI